MWFQSGHASCRLEGSQLTLARLEGLVGHHQIKPVLLLHIGEVHCVTVPPGAPMAECGVVTRQPTPVG